MKKQFLLSLALIAISTFSIAQPVNIIEAEIVAKNTIAEQISRFKNASDFKIDYAYTELNNENEVFHVFNLKPQGFIIVSASKSIEPILAFSYESSCPQNDRQPAVEWMLNNYSKQINYVIAENLAPTNKQTNRWEQLSVNPNEFVSKTNYKAMEPLLKTTWNQGRYYNAHCPEDPQGTDGHVATGCVATAIGQLMNYFRHPSMGNGSYAYNHDDYGLIEVDFSQQSYNYDQMPVEPSDYSDDMARLIYNIGASVDMNYGPDGSGMWNHKGAYTMHTYFDYNPSTEYLFKDSLAVDFDWNGTLVNHLDQKIPLYYAGWSDYDFIMGHAFILDGYSDSTHYHINWGWGGSSDGYFLISDLTPGGSDFTLLHEVIVNAVPNSAPQYCDGLKTLNTFEGIIEDGSGPLEDYQNDSECTWLISPQDSISGISFEFLKLEIDNDDYIIVYDGPTDDSPILETIYGDTNISEFESSSEEVLIKFVTDSDSVNNGWLLAYNGLKPKYCVLMETITEQSGTITDGSNSYLYQNNTFCNWKIQPENAQSIRVTFTEFDIEPINDFIRIIDANNQTVAKLSGSEIPTPLLIMGENITITFDSDNGIRNQGFSCYYEINKAGVDDNLLNNISIFPNPTKDELFLNLVDIYGEANISIVGYDGKILLKETVNCVKNTKHQFKTQDLTSGLYFIEVKYNDSVKRMKFIKE